MTNMDWMDVGMSTKGSNFSITGFSLWSNALSPSPLFKSPVAGKSGSTC